jgi:hypothetical protein
MPLASILDLFNNNNAQDAANAQIAGINTGQTQALGALNAGLNTATNTATAGLGATNTNLATDQAGQTQLANALGLNGTAGAQSAVANWQATNPAYAAQLQQGSNNVLRNQAATGNLASGATDVDLQTLGQNQANATYQQYLQNLQPFVGASTANAGTAAYTGTQLAGLQNANYGQQASLDYGANTSIGNANANADLANNAAAANQLGAITSGLSTGAKLLSFL